MRNEERVWRIVETTGARGVGGRRTEWLNERITARQKSERERHEKSHLFSPDSTHTAAASAFTCTQRTKHIHKSCCTHKHTRMANHTQTHTHRWILVCSLCNCVCLPIIMNSFKTLMQQHLDIQHSKSFFSHRIWKLWSPALLSQISNHPSWEKFLNYSDCRNKLSK